MGLHSHAGAVEPLPHPPRQPAAQAQGRYDAACAQCGGNVRVIGSIEDPAVIGKILGHLAARELTVKS